MRAPELLSEQAKLTILTKRLDCNSLLIGIVACFLLGIMKGLLFGFKVSSGTV